MRFFIRDLTVRANFSLVSFYLQLHVQMIFDIEGKLPIKKILQILLNEYFPQM